MYIIGAGLSGLIAATQFPQAAVYEANGPDAISHKAVLRFRSDSLSRLLGIPFRKVKVRKGVWSNGDYRPITIDLANSYSRKTNGSYLDRSIWNIDPVERYIAPESLQMDLVNMVGNRLNWNAPIKPEEICSPEPCISTVPMPVLIKMLKKMGKATIEESAFKFASIKVARYRVSGADLFQTVYFADRDMEAYRASITKDLLIVESIDNDDAERDGMDEVLRAFGLRAADISLIEASHRQRFGKIQPIDDDVRRSFIYSATIRHHIYSLGRFATWRNILLDDVVDDVAVIKRLLQQGLYGATLHHTKDCHESRIA